MKGSGWDPDMSGKKTHFALLRLLSWKPMSGYEIKTIVDVGLSHFWNENYGLGPPLDCDSAIHACRMSAGLCSNRFRSFFLPWAHSFLELSSWPILSEFRMGPT